MRKFDSNRLNELLKALSSEKGNEAEDAQFIIQDEFGVDALDPVLNLIPELSDFPRRCALDFINNCVSEGTHELQSSKIENMLLPCLKLDDEVSRAWTAEILEMVGTEKSVSPLLDAMLCLKAKNIPPDWHEPIAIRSALRRLGAMKRNCPAIVADNTIRDKHFHESWSLVGINRVLDALINENQVIISFQIWRYKQDSYYWAQANRKNEEIDFTQPWPHIVKASFEIAQKVLGGVKMTNNYRATFDWISETDLPHRR
jgi:hypothetical protein